MLTKRIIPCLDCTLDEKGGTVVKGVEFVNLRRAGDPVEMAMEYNRQGADELIFLDITASHERRRTMIDVVERTADQVFIPMTVGGGINSTGNMKDILRAGADKITVNTAAVKRPELILEGARLFGSQCIVVAVDCRQNTSIEEGKEVLKLDDGTPVWYEVVIYGGREPTGIDAVEWGRKVEGLGAGEIMLTSMNADGTKDGYDLPITRKFSEELGIPIIASGGAGNAEHIYEVLTDGKADAALAASIFHFGEVPIPELKMELAARGLPMRL